MATYTAVSGRLGGLGDYFARHGKHYGDLI